MHTHISVHPLGKSTPSSTPNLSGTESSFLAGLLEHLPAVQAFTMALPPSYDHMIDGVWSSGTYVCWGDSNKEVPVRLCNRYSDSSRNFEVKCVDGLANPWVSVATRISRYLTQLTTPQVPFPSRDARRWDTRDYSGEKSYSERCVFRLGCQVR